MTSSLSFTVAYQPSNVIQPTYTTPPDALIFPGAAASFIGTYLTLPAAGTSVTLPVPSTWTHVEQVIVQNLDNTGLGYCVLTLNGTTGAPVIQLETGGGMFASSFGSAVPSGTVAANPSVWTLKTCDVNGILANGQSTLVYIFLAGT